MLNISRWLRRPRLKCAAVTPVGPGHAERARECRASIEAAWRLDQGPFTDLEFHFVDDGRGAFGRSKARNMGVQAARTAGADWIFFLDADDLMTPQAFSIFAGYAAQFDAVWGLMSIKPPDTAEHHIRFPQALTLRSIDELLLLDPFMTLLMGHFVRTAVALDLQFDESMDAGEDFDYYIRAWQKYRCTKIAEVLSINRSDQHSSGPRAATADQWRVAATARLNAGLRDNGVERHSSRAIAAVNRCSAEAQAFSRGREETDSNSLLSNAHSLPYRGWVEVVYGIGGTFSLFSDNDDPAALSVGWTGDYLPASSRLWQILASEALMILDLGAGTGYFGLLAARAASKAEILCCEPLAASFERLEMNLAINEARNVHALRIVSRAVDGKAQLRALNPADRQLTEIAALHDGCPRARDEAVRSVDLDSLLKAEGSRPAGLIRMGAGVLAADIVAALGESAGDLPPDLLMARERVDCKKMEDELRRRDYRCYVIDEDSGTVARIERLMEAAATSAVYCWATLRPEEDAARIIEAADCNVGRTAR
ncbi:MAG TPA: FkbM family methyltransferase [Burkholderiales bacterium]|jgi:FkbM family methyltransferase|nr:FkbM family methyltransferase [Burkholderiales bacterium]